MSFPETRWTDLAQATLHGDAPQRAALEDLCERYWGPVHAAIGRLAGRSEEARDLTQAFFAHVLEHSTLRQADRARGRFRTFLLTVLWRFLKDERERRGAAKRGAGVEALAFDELSEADQPGRQQAVAETLDREWAMTVLARALDTVRSGIVAGRGVAAWEVLRGYLPGSLHVPENVTAAAALGLSEAGLRTEVHRLRQRCREALRRELLPTVATPGEVDGELAYLARLLRGEAGVGGDEHG